MTLEQIAATGLGPRNPGDLRAVRTYQRRLHSKLSEDTSGPHLLLCGAPLRLPAG